MLPSFNRRRVRTALTVVAATLTLAGAGAAHAAEARSGKAKARQAPTAAAAPVQIADAGPEQLAAADRVLIGRYDCEFGQRVTIDRHDTHSGYFNLRLGQQSWIMKPVLSSTGAVRLEDVRGAALMIQILTKSMLMDQRKGQRLVDGCVHDVQRVAERDLASRPRESMLGIAPR